MPRISAKKKEYIIKDLAWWIEGRMRRKHMRQADAGRLLNMTQASFCEKLNKCKNGLDKLRVGELMILFQELGATDEEILKFMKI